jgi:glucose-6-phosphate 1-epimerase
MSDVVLPDSVTLADGEGGLPLVRVRAPGGAAEVYLHGAHVTAWTPAGQAPVIWMSRRSLFEPGRAIRGGVPICFPWFGPGRSGDMSPAHGFARVADWTLAEAQEDGDAVVMTLRLTDGDVAGLPGVELWPHRFEALYRITVGAELGLELSVRNTGAEAISFEEALHTYLSVSDIHEVQVDGLDGATYVDKTSGGALVRQEGPVVFTGETDRVYRTTADVEVRDGARTIVVARSTSANTVVWNPWIAKAAAMADFGDDEWPTMVCVETANVADEAVVLAAGDSHAVHARMSVMTHAGRP